MARNSHFGHDDRTDMMYHQRGGKPGKLRNRFGQRFDQGPPGGGKMRYEDLDGDVDMTGPDAFRNPEKRFAPDKPNKKKYRTSFNQGPPGGGRMRYEDLDGDVDMAGPDAFRNPEKRFAPYKPNKNYGEIRKWVNRMPPPHPRSWPSEDPDGVWFKIIIPDGEQLDRQFILKVITSACRQDFTPYNFQYHNGAAIFYVDSFDAAQSIRNIKHQIQTPMGTKMLIHVRENTPIASVVNSEVREAIRECLGRHYDAGTHSLDLSMFHHDAGLKESGHYIPLHKPIIVSAVVKIIKENIPEIERLDLSHNRLYSLEMIANLAPVCRHIVALNLRNNMFKSITVLNSLKGMNIVEVILDGNPLCYDFRDQASYISEVRKSLPEVMCLDGQELPAPVTLDLNRETVPSSAMPIENPSPAPSVKKVVEDERLSVATVFSQITGMNMEFSVRCLGEFGWDYDKAAECFVSLKDVNQIPAEAFMK